MALRLILSVLSVGLAREGMNKLVVNHLDKTIVTSDGATIVRELEVMHPAAKMVVMASQMQEQEAGDGTSLVVTLTGKRGEKLSAVGCCFTASSTRVSVF